MGPLRRVLAAIAARLVDTRAYERLCYARLSDYARERPGVSARQLQELARVHRALERLPALEAALVGNALPWSKVRLLARLARPDDERAWVARAQLVPTRRLAEAVRRAHPGGAEPAEPGPPLARVVVRCSPAVRGKWLAVRELAERVAGERLSDAEALEAVVAELCSAVPPEADEPGAGPGGAQPRHEGSDLEGAAPERRAPAPRLPREVTALALGLESADAFELDRRLLRAVRLEQTLDAAVAPLLRTVSSPEYEWLGRYQPLPAYAPSRLGMSASKARALLRLERAGDVCPPLRRAYRRGELSWVKAQCLVPLLRLDVEGEWRAVWVRWAARVTVRRLAADVERALLLRAGHDRAWQRCKAHPERAQDPLPPDEQQSCAHDVDVEATQQLRFHVPRDVALLLGAALDALGRRSRPRPAGDGPLFEQMLDLARASWLLRDPKSPRPDPVIERDGYLCAVPGCSSRRNLHDHHIRFRSAGGSDAPENRITLCAFHHQRCLHAGLLRIRGRAPAELVFELGLHGEAGPLARYASGDVALREEPSARRPPPPRASDQQRAA